MSKLFKYLMAGAFLTALSFAVLALPVIFREEIGATSAAAVSIGTVPLGSHVCILPTVAGTAQVQSCRATDLQCRTDVASNSFPSDRWIPWQSGNVTTFTCEVSAAAISRVAVTPSSGTWTLSVTFDGARHSG